MRTRLYFCATALLAGLCGWSLLHTTAAKAASGRSLSSLQGTYGYTLQGTLAMSTPLAGVGLIVADGNGGITGTETLQVYGQGTQTNTFAGSYTMNNDGAGTITINYPAPPPPAYDPDNPPPPQAAPLTAKYDFVMVSGVAHMKAMRSENGIVATADFMAQ